MAVHDWTRVDAGIFHDLHFAWIAEFRRVLNGGLLPQGYYALAEQHAGRTIPDLLALHASPAAHGRRSVNAPVPGGNGGVAVAQAPPRVRRRHTLELKGPAHPRTVAIRHVSGHRLVALLEVVSPANKDRPKSIEDFASKAVSALNAGIHLLVVDLFPPGRHDPYGMHGVITQHLQRSDEPYDLPPDEPLTLAAYEVGRSIEVYLEHLAVGSDLPEMPLFLEPDRYVKVPLEATYQTAYTGMPAIWREVLEAPQPPAA
jgi:Protein of unknown function (DUF4058)